MIEQAGSMQLRQLRTRLCREVPTAERTAQFEAMRVAIACISFGSATPMRGKT